MLPEHLEFIRNGLVEKPEITCIQGYRIRTHEVQQPVIAPCGKLLCGSLSLAVQPLAVGYIGALLPGLHHIGNDLRRVLQISVHDYHRVALRFVHAGGNRQLMAEIP